MADVSVWRRSVTLESGRQLVVRLATHEDYRAVVDIDKQHEIYNGHDYVPHLYHELLQEKHSYTFVGLLDGTIVYFTIMHVVEDGRSTVSCAARVSDACRGQKVADTARKLVVDVMTQNIPTLTLDRWTGVLWDNVLAALRKPVPPLKILHGWYFTPVLFRNDTLSEFLSRIKPVQTTHSCRLLTVSEASAIISDPVICRRIFPQIQTIFLGHDWMPHTVPRPQISAAERGSHFYGVYEGQQLVAVGTCYSFPSVNATEIQTVYYGKHDVDCLKLFILAVLNANKKHSRNGKPLSFVLSSPEEINQKEIASFFAGCEILHMKKAAYMSKY